MLEWHFWMHMVLLNERVIRYSDFLHNVPLLSPKHVRGPAPLGYMDDAILIVSNEFWFCVSFSHLNIFLIEPWQHAGLVIEGSWVRSSVTLITFFFAFISLKFFFHKKSWVQIPFFNFQGGPLLCSQKFSQWNFYQ